MDGLIKTPKEIKIKTRDFKKIGLLIRRGNCVYGMLIYSRYRIVFTLSRRDRIIDGNDLV